MAKIIMFDVDGVLIKGFSNNPDLCDRWDKNIKQDLGIDSHHLSEGFFKKDFSLVITGKKDLKEALAENLPEFGYTGSVDAFIKYWFEHDSTVNFDIMPMVDKLHRSKKALTYIATNQEVNRAGFLWNDVEFKRFFRDIYYSAAIGYSKTDPKFFETVDGYLTASEKPLIIDDSIRVIENAKSCGWDTILYTKPEDVNDNQLLLELVSGIEDRKPDDIFYSKYL